MSNPQKTPQELFAERLKQARENKGLSQRGAAKLLGFSQSALSLWELGKNMPELNVMVRLAEFYDVPFDWLSGTAQDLKVKSVHEVYTVPLLPMGALVDWDIDRTYDAVQSTNCFLPASAAAVAIESDLLALAQPGDLAIIERDQKLAPNGVYFILLAGSKAPTLRRCVFDGGDICFVNDVGTGVVIFGPGVKVIGRVREIVRRTLL